MRVVLSLATGELTTREIQAKMPDVPQATLYRAINRLLHAKRIDVVENRKRGGATERVYRLAPGHRGVTSAVRNEIIALSPEAAEKLATDLAAIVNRAVAESEPGGHAISVSYSVLSSATPAPGQQ